MQIHFKIGKQIASLLVLGVAISGPTLAQNTDNQKFIPLENYVPNYTSISYEQPLIDDELKNAATILASTHPEYGLNYPGTPCEDCFEVIEKRTVDSKYYILKGTEGKAFAIHKSFSPLHYLNSENQWITIDRRIKPNSLSPGLFSAEKQPFPTFVHTAKEEVWIRAGEHQILWNNELELFHKKENGSITSLGPANWSNYTAGDDGIYINNAWEGIDIELFFNEGAIKTNFVIQRLLPFSDGSLIFTDHFEVNANLRSPAEITDPFFGELVFSDSQGKAVFTLSPAMSYDRSGEHVSELNYTFTNNQLGIHVPVAILNEPNLVYPLIVDPLLSATNALTPATTMGSTRNDNCTYFPEFCQHNLTVDVPPKVEVVNITTQFQFIAISPCVRRDGGFSFQYNGCNDPVNTALTWTCPNPPGAFQPGVCGTGAVRSQWSEFGPCVPDPQCASYPMEFGLQLKRRCKGNSVPCSTGCVHGFNQWRHTVFGRTVEVPASAAGISPDQTICIGDNAVLYANGIRGVPPYDVVWEPGTITGSPVTVSPAITTTYTATVTDACGEVAVRETDVTVIQNPDPGFSINPNPVCEDEDVTMSGGGTFAASQYDWQLPGSSSPVVADMQDVTVQYADPGIYDVILDFAVGTCVFPDTLQLEVLPVLSPDVVISASSNPICEGDIVTFIAVASNIDDPPDYQWTVNGLPVGSSSFTYSTDALNDGDLVSVTLLSNDACADPTSINSNEIEMTVLPVVNPSVAISADPSGALCFGTLVTFTADTSFGGAVPEFIWTVNGTDVGNNAAVYLTDSLNDGDVVVLTFISSNLCAEPDTVFSNEIVISSFPPIVVEAIEDFSICQGEEAELSALASGGDGGPYDYVWNNGGGSGSTVTVSPATSTIYEVTATDACGSTPGTDEVVLTVFQNPVADFIYTPPLIEIGDDVSFQDISTGTSISSWFWDFGDGNTSSFMSPGHIFSTPGTYEVSLTVGANGCFDEVTYTLIAQPDFVFFIPNSFSPNGDGVNDLFEVRGENIESITMKVYNRWGEIVYQQIGEQALWDGMQGDGTLAGQGIYTYEISLISATKGERETVRGHINVLR